MVKPSKYTPSNFKLCVNYMGKANLCVYMVKPSNTHFKLCDMVKPSKYHFKLCDMVKPSKAKVIRISYLVKPSKSYLLCFSI